MGIDKIMIKGLEIFSSHVLKNTRQIKKERDEHPGFPVVKRSAKTYNRKKGRTSIRNSPPRKREDSKSLIRDSYPQKERILRWPMQLLLKDIPLLDIGENGTCTILDFDRLPFSLRKENITFIDFIEWASNRTLSIGRSFAKEILNALRLSQTNRYAVCKA